MTDITEIIATVRRLDAEATPGPWCAGSKGHVYALESTLVTLAGGPGHSLAAPPPDAALIAHYRTAAPALASEVERLRERVGVLHYWLATQPICQGDTDQTITCVICDAHGCEFSIRTTNGGDNRWHGIHKTCRQDARSALEGKP